MMDKKTKVGERLKEVGRDLREACLRAAYEIDRFGLEYRWAMKRLEKERNKGRGDRRDRVKMV